MIFSDIADIDKSSNLIYTSKDTVSGQGSLQGADIAIKVWRNYVHILYI